MRRKPFSAAVLALALVLGRTASASADAAVTAAHHAGTVTATTLRFRSEYVLPPDTTTIDFAFPLPAGTTLEPSSDTDPIVRDGRLVGLRVAPIGAGARHLVVTLEEPLDRHGDALRVGAPLAAGDALQIVEVTGADELRFEPDPRTGLERHVGFFAPEGLSPGARRACDRALGYVRLRTVDDPAYVRATPLLVSDAGLRGAVSTRGERHRAGVLGAFGIFVALVLGLALLQRRLARAASLERGEQTLAAEFERLDHPAR